MNDLISLRVLVVVGLMTLVTACSKRGEFVYMSEVAPAKVEQAEGETVIETVFVATSRKEEDGKFSFNRSEKTNFMRFDVSVPKVRELGEVNWPRSVKAADPAKDFIVADEQTFQNGPDFKRNLKSALKASGQREIVLYVHGYNNTMAESVYRVAQMHRDLKVPGVAVHYSWPSRGSALGYVYDRDSALFGRGGLEELITELSEVGAERITIVGHSMGAALTMETIRQIGLRGNHQALSRMGGVILISPDLDVDVFRAQAKDFGPLPQPFLIFGNSRDSILGISSKLSGAPDRLGNLKDPRVLSDLNVIYYDTQAYNQGSGHFNFATSPALLQLLGGISSLDEAFSAEGKARVGLLPGVAMTMRNATSVVLLPVEAVADAATR